MNRKLLLLLAFTSIFNSSNAQLVYLPDTIWRNFLINNGLSACITNDTLDAGCADIASITSLNCQNKGITDVSGLQYFYNLNSFNCSSNLITNFPGLPNSLVTLHCTDNLLTGLPTLPPALSILQCGINQLISLPSLPQSLQSLNCGRNNLNALPTLPDSLSILWCAFNQLTTLPVLNTYLTTLDCGNNLLTDSFTINPNLISLKCESNQLTRFGFIPISVRELFVSENPLGVLPVLPDSLIDLHCRNTGLTALPVLPWTLEILYADLNQISVIDTLPPALKSLSLNTNILSQLPVLPDSLLRFYINDNLFNTLPVLPQSLLRLGFSGNNISVFDTCPPALQYLSCGRNPLTYLPAFPNSFSSLLASNCSIQYIVSLPDTQYTYFHISDNPIACMPPITKTGQLRISNTNIHCIPHAIEVVGSCDVDLDTIPICGLTSGCDVYWNITGNLKNDINNDCINDLTEIPIKNLPVKLYISGLLSQICYTDHFGQYYFKAPLGSYEVRVDSLEVPFNLNCPANGTWNINLTPVDSLIDSLDFAMSCKQTNDLKVQLINPSSFFEPAAVTPFYLNAGDVSSYFGGACFVQSGSVEVILSSNVSYAGPMISALPPSVINGDTLIWNVPDFSLVDPETTFNMYLLTDTFALSGDSVCVTVNILPSNDYNLTNNTLSECYPVVASFDPNEKTIAPALPDTSDHSFTFVVYFQNTGTAIAHNIYILDTLDNDLDPTTFELIGSSHEVITQMLPGNILRFNYPLIELQDSNANEPASHGFVKYRINRKSTTTVGTEITNTAYIFFDYNEPVITNTVAATVTIQTGVTQNSTSRKSLMVYPNPASELLNIIGDFNISTIKLLDILGKEKLAVNEINRKSVTLRIPDLQSGIYLLKVTDEMNNNFVNRIIIR